MYAVVTDIRFDEYEEDEVYWLKNEMGGILVHISLFEFKNGKKIFNKPANSDEASQNPRLLEKADYIIEWEKVKGEKLDIHKSLQPIMKDFLKFIQIMKGKLMPIILWQFVIMIR